MTQQTSPFLEGKFGWDYGEDGWNTGMDENLLKFSFMFDRNVDGVVSSLPTVVNGQSWFLTTDNRLYFAVGGTFYSSPTPKWFQFTIKSTGVVYQFNGTTVDVVDSLSQLDTRLDAVEVTVSGLGTAAFEDVGYFATQGALDSATAQANNYTDTLRSDLQNFNDYTKGAVLVGKSVRYVDSVVELVGLVGREKNDTVTTASYWGTWGDLLTLPQGGAEYVWDPACLKSRHNAGSIISPTVPWNGTEATFAAYIAKTGETDPSGSGCWVHKNSNSSEWNVLQWGAKADATTAGANDAMIQPLLNLIELPTSGGFGGVVLFPRGHYAFATYFNVRDRTTLRGEGTACTILSFTSTSSGDCITLGPTGPNSSRGAGMHVFQTRLENLAVSGRDVYRGSEKALVYTDGAHEHSGLFSVVLRNFTSWGLNYNTGNGGPAHFEVNGAELYASPTLPSLGTRRGIVCQAGGAVITLNGVTITGSSTGNLAHGVIMLKDNLNLVSGHFEYCTVGVSLSQTDATNPRVDKINAVTGNATTPTLIDVSTTFQGAFSVTSCINKSTSTTGLITLINRANGGETFTDVGVSSYSYPKINGEAVCTGLVVGSSGVITQRKGRPFTVTRTAAGTYTVTFSAAMPDTNYIVVPIAVSGTVLIPSYSITSTTVFVVTVRSTAGTATDPTSLTFSVYSN
jgi:hypothetical protein